MTPLVVWLGCVFGWGVWFLVSLASSHNLRPFASFFLVDKTWPQLSSSKAAPWKKIVHACRKKLASLGSPAGLCGFACWVGGWEFCLETSLAHGSLVSTAFGDLRFFIYFATYSSMSDVVIHLPLVC